MVDSIKYNNQIYQEQQQIEFQIPQIRCQDHQNQFIECININTDQSNQLFCFKCAIQNGQNLETNKLVLLEEIFSKDSQNTIKNWPPLQDEKLKNFLNDKENKKDKKCEQIQKINQKFDQLRNDIIVIINEHEKKILGHVNKIQEKRENLFNIYNQLCSKEDMKIQFYNKKHNFQELQDTIRNIILEKQMQCEYYEQSIRDSVEDLIKCEQILQFDFIDNIIKQNLQSFKSINFLKSFNNEMFENKILNLQVQQNFIHNIKQQKGYQYQIGQQNQIQQLQNQNQIISKENQDPLSNLLEIQSFQDLTQYKNYQRIKIQLDSCYIGVEGVQSLSQELKQLTQLNHLELITNRNNLQCEGVKTLSRAIQHLTQLTHFHLELYENNIGDNGVLFLSKGLKHLTQLKFLKLCLGMNQIGDQGVSSLSLGLKHLTLLNRFQLELQVNNIGDKAIPPLIQVQIVYLL